MLIPVKPADEDGRLHELRSLGILDTPGESLFDDIVKLGAYVSGCPIALISLIDSDRQWFKARVGLNAQQTHRDLSFCGHAIAQDSLFVVEDALQDPRFADNPLVTGDPKIRFYAGRPLTTSNGFRIGTLCMLDRVPRKLTAQQLGLLESLARQTTFLIERRKNERILQMTRRNSQTLFEKNPAIMVSMKGPEHRFEYVNAPHAKFLGNEDVIGKSLLEVQPQADQTGFLQILDQVFHEGQTRSLKNATFAINEVPRHFDLVLTPRYGVDGDIDGVMGILDDITDRKNMEYALKVLHERKEVKYNKMAELLERVPMYVALLEGPNHCFVVANRLYRDQFLEDRAFEGKTVCELFPECEQQGFLAILNGVFSSGVAYVGNEFPFERCFADGRKETYFFNFIYEATKNAEGKVTGVLAASIDVTEQVRSRAEISNQVDALKSEQELRERFVATLSHDLQNPLTAAKMGAERLRRKAHDLATVQKFADRIVNNITRTERMVRDLLDANRIKAGEGMPISPAECCLNDVASQAVNDISSTTGRTLVFVKKHAAIKGFWDAEGLRRVLENLLGNAIKYGQPNAPIVLEASQGAQFAEISVHNQGPAIPAEDLPLLFDTYRRAGCAAQKSQQGWGIGLALVKGIAQAHCGTVHVESQEGKGTTFYVKLPLQGPHHGPARQPPPSAW